MAAFATACTTTGSPWRLHILDQDMNYIWRSADESIEAQHLSFAADRTAGCIYMPEIESSVVYIRKRSTSTGTKLAEYNLTASDIETVTQRMIVVDQNGYLWTHSYSGTDIYKFSSDLTTRTDYTIKAGTVGDSIYYASMTSDGQFIYVTGSAASKNQVAKLSISDLTGDYIWQQTLGSNYCVYPTVGENNNIYLSGQGGLIRKVSAVDGSYLWGSPYYKYGGYFNSYCFETDRLYVAMYNTPSPKRIYQLDPSDGSTVGYTLQQSARTYNTNVYDETKLYTGNIPGGGSPENITYYDITDDWGTTESYLAIYHVANGIYHASYGDSTGYINQQIRINNPVEPEPEPEVPGIIRLLPIIIR